jgi:signal peptidase II
MRVFTRFGLVATLLFACVGCDQVSKSVVRNHIALGYSQSFMGDTLRLTHAENPGAFLSIGASLPRGARVLVFQMGVSLVVLGLLCCALLPRQLGAQDVAGFALLAASGLGNLIDRVLHDGYVTDFLNVGIGSVRTGIFNIADVLGVVGVALLMLRRVVAPRGDSFERAGER